MKLTTFEFYVKRQGKQCSYCGLELNPSIATRDHWVPKSKLRNATVENIRLACSTCNKIKANLTPDIFFGRIRKIFMRYVETELNAA